MIVSKMVSRIIGKQGVISFNLSTKPVKNKAFLKFFVLDCIHLVLREASQLCL